jgi:hypothetical protein
VYFAPEFEKETTADGQERTVVGLCTLKCSCP